MTSARLEQAHAGVEHPGYAVYTRRHGRRYGSGTYSHAPLPLGGTVGAAENPYREDDFGAGRRGDRAGAHLPAPERVGGSHSRRTAIRPARRLSP
ncbi:hypothetical protein [Nocardia arthritidis]|uniref:hypothetical protein n=1 Tax=Nocardia arthritidis TaxID=228602 RepID=UPI0007A37427|nr:hypothetical protein [Nocardia arthritidis]